MTPRVFFVMLLITSIVFTFLGATISKEVPRTALVIGNASYNSSPLRNPVNDASNMAEALRNLGFTVIHKQNAKQRDMEKAIRDFGKRLRKNGGVGLFYYAGHGMQVNGRNYLIPVDAEIETESDVKYEAVDAGRVLGKMEDADNNLNIVILDACRDNPFAKSFRSGNKGLAKMDAPTGSIVAYATAPGSVAADGMSRNGLYTSMLLKHITTPGLRIEEFFKIVRIDVMNDSNKKQVPWESSSLTGDFYFNPGRGIAVRERPKLKEVTVDRKRVRKKRDKDIAIIGDFLLSDGQSDEALRGLLTSIFSQHSAKLKLSSGAATSDNHDILIRGKVLGITKDTIADKEAQEAQQAANMMKGFLKSFGNMSGDKKTPFSNLEIPVRKGENKTLVKVRVLVSASYVNDDAFYSQTAVAIKTVGEDKADTAVLDLTFEATKTAGNILFDKLRAVKVSSAKEPQTDYSPKIPKRSDSYGRNSNINDSEEEMHRE